MARINKLFFGLFIVYIFQCMLSGCFVFDRKVHSDSQAYYKAALIKAPYDVAIVPGYPYHRDSMSFIMVNRVYWALHLYKKGIVRNFIFSGSAVYSPYKEGIVMALFAEKIGIPKENIFIESKAEHSIENLYHSYKIAKDLGFQSIVFASDPSQSNFVKSINDKRFKMDVGYIPIIYDTLRVMNKVVPKLNFQEALVTSFISIEDREGILTRLRGTRGHRVKMMLRDAH